MNINSGLISIINSNIENIEENDFEFLKDCTVAQRVQLAEIFLEADIDVTNIEQKVRFKDLNISRFLNDLRIDRNEVVIQKGPANLGANCSIEGDNYFIRFKSKTLSESDAKFLMEAYNIEHILECKRWDGRLYTSVYYSVFIFNN